jgi:hypothetical protein
VCGKYQHWFFRRVIFCWNDCKEITGDFINKNGKGLFFPKVKLDQDIKKYKNSEPQIQQKTQNN